MRGKKRYIKLKKDEKVKLKKGRKTGKKAVFRQRCHHILLSDHGKTIQELPVFIKLTVKLSSADLISLSRMGLLD